MHYKTLNSFVFLLSYTSIIKKAAKANQESSFSNQSDYYNQLINKKGFSYGQIFFLPLFNRLNVGKMYIWLKTP